MIDPKIGLSQSNKKNTSHISDAVNQIQNIRFFVGFGIYQSTVPFTIGFPWPLFQNSVLCTQSDQFGILATCSDRIVLPDMYGNVSLWTSLAVGLSMLYTTSRLHTCQASVFVTPVQVFIPVPCYTSFRYLRGHRACFLLAAWTRTIPIFSSPICNTI